jgi:hypothetical protein
MYPAIMDGAMTREDAEKIASKEIIDALMDIPPSPSNRVIDAVYNCTEYTASTTLADGTPVDVHYLIHGDDRHLEDEGQMDWSDYYITIG